jgi:hypothetical protein
MLNRINFFVLVFCFLPSVFVSASDRIRFEHTLSGDVQKSLNSLIEYLNRLQHYEKNIFKRSLTEEEKKLYLGCYLGK